MRCALAPVGLRPHLARPEQPAADRLALGRRRGRRDLVGRDVLPGREPVSRRRAIVLVRVFQARHRAGHEMRLLAQLRPQLLSSGQRRPGRGVDGRRAALVVGRPGRPMGLGDRSHAIRHRRRRRSLARPQTRRQRSGRRLHKDCRLRSYADVGSRSRVVHCYAAGAGVWFGRNGGRL